MSKAVRIVQHGGPEVLQLETVDIGRPGAGEVIVRHHAIGLNFIDTYHRSGLYPLTLPTGLGLEAVGVIEALGAGVEASIGQRVGCISGPPGAYAERRIVAADRLIPLPDDVDDHSAAAALLKGMTVEYLIQRTFPVQPGQTVLWHAAGGGVGLLACQWLRHLGVRVIGTVGSDAKAARALAHGCTHTIVYERENFVERVLDLTEGKGVPVVFDSVGKATFDGSLDCLQPRGMFVGFGNASGKPSPFDMQRLAQKGSLFLTRPTLMSYTATRPELLASAEALFAVMRSGAVRAEVDRSWPLAEVAEAHRCLEARQTSGSCLLIP